MIEIRNKNGAVIYIHPDSNAVDFDGSDLHGLNLTNAYLEGAVFSDANLSGANLENSDLYWAILFRANLNGANLKGAVLRGCDMKFAKLIKADLRGADLSQDNVGGSTQLQGADLSDCLIDGTKFGLAAFDAKTILPKGLDPQAHGMIYIDIEE